MVLASGVAVLQDGVTLVGFVGSLLLVSPPAAVLALPRPCRGC